MAKRTVVALVEIEFEIECNTVDEFDDAKQAIFDNFDFRTVGKLGHGFADSMARFQNSDHWNWNRIRSKVRSISERPFKKR